MFGEDPRSRRKTGTPPCPRNQNPCPSRGESEPQFSREERELDARGEGTLAGEEPSSPHSRDKTEPCPRRRGLPASRALGLTAGLFRRPSLRLLVAVFAGTRRRPPELPSHATGQGLPNHPLDTWVYVRIRPLSPRGTPSCEKRPSTVLYAVGIRPAAPRFDARTRTRRGVVA